MSKNFKSALAVGIVSILSLFIFAGNAFAESASTEGSRRGLVTSTQCPYSCQTAGLTPDNCREWQVGDKCMVEDLTQAPGHRSMIRVRQDQMLDSKAAMHGSKAK